MVNRKPTKPVGRHKPPRRGSKPATQHSKTKQSRLVEMLQRSEGATIDQLCEATGWQPHSVRGAISGGLKKKLGLSIVSERSGGRPRVYRARS